MTWLYVPSEFLRRASELVASSWDSRLPRAALPKLYVASSGTVSPQPLSWPGFKTRHWLRFLYGTTSRPLTANRGAELWISSLRESHASRPPAPASAVAKKMNAGSGQSRYESSGKCSRPSSSSKTSEASSPSVFEMYSETFKSLATSLRLNYSARRKSRRLIAGIASSSLQPAWRTPATSDVGVSLDLLTDKDGNPPKLGARMYRSRDGKPVRSKTGEIIPQSQTLELQVRLLNSSSASSRRSPWRTPHASDGEGGVMEMRPDADAHLKLRDHVANWATPQAHDVHGAKTPAQVADQRKRTGAGTRNLNEDVRNWPTPRAEDSESAGNHTGARTHPGDSLTGVLKSWPTPASRDGKGTNSETHVTTKGTGRKHMDQLPNFVEHGLRTGEIRSASFLPTRTTRSRGHKCSIKCRRLNQHFASWLMNFPIGWISFGASETALWLFRARTRLASLLAGYAHVFNLSSPPWSTPRAGEGRDGDQSRRASEIDFAPMLCAQARSWQTPRAQDDQSSPDAQRKRMAKLDAKSTTGGPHHTLTGLAAQTRDVTSKRNWPTPHSLAGDGHGSELSMTATVAGGYSKSERTKKKMGWPTPRANTLEGRGTAKRKPGTGGRILNEEAEKWPTPMGGRRGADYHKKSRGTGEDLIAKVQRWPTPRSSEGENRTQSRSKTHGKSHGRLLSGEAVAFKKKRKN